MQTCLQEGMGLDGTPLHEHEETIVSRVRMQAGIEKARSADDSEKEKEKKKAEVQESKKREALTIPKRKKKRKKPRRRNRKSAERGRFRKGNLFILGEEK